MTQKSSPDINEKRPPSVEEIRAETQAKLKPLSATVLAENITKYHKKKIGQIRMLPDYKYEQGLTDFLGKYMKNIKRYERVARATGIPAILVAAIHARESGQDFSTYPHNGDPLVGDPTIHDPKGILFKKGEWEKAAIHALGGNIKDENGKPSMKRFKKIRDRLKMNPETKDIATMLTFAELYNGLGYRNSGKPSPYIYSGTNLSQPGLYAHNGELIPKAVSETPGIAPLLLAANGVVQLNS